MLRRIYLNRRIWLIWCRAVSWAIRAILFASTNLSIHSSVAHHCLALFLTLSALFPAFTGWGPRTVHQAGTLGADALLPCAPRSLVLLHHDCETVSRILLLDHWLQVLILLLFVHFLLLNLRHSRIYQLLVALFVESVVVLTSRAGSWWIGRQKLLIVDEVRVKAFLALDCSNI